ncbi:MAG: ribbon-helix-helix domain-containing protein [Desulfotomaculales bacterium]
MAQKSILKKVTFALPESLLEKLRYLATNKRVPSVNAAVREALEQYLTGIEKDDFRRDMEAAARDPLFLKDVKTTQASYGNADAEAARLIPEW